MPSWPLASAALLGAALLGVAAPPSPSERSAGGGKAPAAARPPRPSASPSAEAASPSPSPSSSPSPAGPIILFLVDNSASLPPLDPEEKRVAALEKMFTFLQGRPYRLILFGGRREVYVDDVTEYRNNGQWTDFYFAFDKAREVMATYPNGTDFRLVFVTDAILDPSPEDWADMDVPPGVDLKAHAVEKTLAIIKELGVPLYVILVGDAPEVSSKDNPERAPGLILDMVKAANGARAAPFAQSVSAFFSDDGVLLKKFIFRVEPAEGLKRIQPIVTRITAPATVGVEAELFGAVVLPLVLFLFLLLGILVRAFPGPGDVEIVELSLGQPVHLAADKMRRVEGGWSTTGLSLVADNKDAAATLTYQAPNIDLSGTGVDTTGADPITVRLLALPLDELKKALEGHADFGSKEEKIFVLNLEYMAKNLSTAEAEKILTSPHSERHKIAAVDYLRAKAALMFNDTLKRTLLDPRVVVLGYGKGAERKELRPGAAARIGPYVFLVQDVAKGGRKDVRLLLHYDRIPSLLGLKNWLPDRFQQIFRFRRSAYRIVS